jgi:hypothetical protein
MSTMAGQSWPKPFLNILRQYQEFHRKSKIQLPKKEQSMYTLISYLTYCETFLSCGSTFAAKLANLTLQVQPIRRDLQISSTQRCDQRAKTEAQRLGT